jgi:transcriptional regulator with XRE-family HTH domain
MAEIDGSANPLAFFAAELKRIRTAAKLSIPALAKAINYSAEQLYKVESCARIPQEDLAGKLDHYFGSDGHFCRMQELVENTSVLPWMRSLVNTEGAAVEIRVYESYFLPGLLQTEAYARGLAEAARPSLSAEDIDRAVASKLTRQEIFSKPDPPRVWAVIDAAVLYRQIGKPDMMREQFEHLIRMNQLANVTLQVISATEAACCASGRSFTLLTLPGKGDIVYLEDIGSANYVRKREDAQIYFLAFDYLRGSALPDNKSAELIERECHAG